MNFRLETNRPEDIERVLELVNSGQLPAHGALDHERFGSREAGFLTQLTRREAEVLWRGGKVIVALNDEERVAGFIAGFSGDSELFKELLRVTERGIEWQRPGVLEIPNLVYADRWIVRIEQRSAGVGMELCYAFLRQFPGASLLTAVAERPVPNERMGKLIGHLGFERVGCFRAEQFRGFRNFQSGLYLKAER